MAEPESLVASFGSAFRSLRSFNYRVWAIGALISNIGTWFQRVAQDWLVLTQLTDSSATSLGIVMALQTGPMLVLLPVSGLAADRLDRRKLLIATQALQAMLALALGLLVLTGLCRLWHVYALALLLGCVTAFDAPARHAFASDLVDDANLSNAVSLNSTSFNLARLVGPACAGMVIAAAGTGWAMIVNGLSFVGVLASLFLLRTHQLRARERAAPARRAILEGFRYAWERPDLRTVLLMLLSIGTLGLNFPIFVSTMTTIAFGAGAARLGLLTSIMAIGSVLGALLVATRDRPRFGLLMIAAGWFGGGLLAASLAPNIWLLGAALAVVGGAAVGFTTLTMSYMQLATAPAMRGRVLSIRLAVGMGCTPLGAPLVGWVADMLGPRWAVGVGAASGFAAAVLAYAYIAKFGEDDRS